MQLTRDLFAIAKFLLSYAPDKQTNRLTRKSYPPNNSHEVFLTGPVVAAAVQLWEVGTATIARR